MVLLSNLLLPQSTHAASSIPKQMFIPLSARPSYRLPRHPLWHLSFSPVMMVAKIEVCT